MLFNLNFTSSLIISHKTHLSYLSSIISFKKNPNFCFKITFSLNFLKFDDSCLLMTDYLSFILNYKFWVLREAKYELSLDLRNYSNDFEFFRSVSR